MTCLGCAGAGDGLEGLADLDAFASCATAADIELLNATEIAATAHNLAAKNLALLFIVLPVVHHAFFVGIIAPQSGVDSIPKLWRK